MCSRPCRQAVEDAGTAAEHLKALKKELKVAIAKSKKSCLDELVQSVENNQFGKP